MKRAIAALLLVLPPAARAQLLGRTTVAAVGGANALSPPAARHLVRTASGTYVLALQRDRGGAPSGLVLYQSADDGRTWSLLDTLDADPAARQTADLIAVGDDVALVRSFDAPSIAPDAALDPGRKVYFQWWRSDGQGGWTAEPPVVVFDPPAGSAYHRAELAIDGAGRIWVQAFRRGPAACDPLGEARCAMCFETANGDNYANDVVVAVSGDGGLTFSAPQTLAQTLCRAGGRLISLGTRLLLLWNDYSANQNGTVIATRFLVRDDLDPEDFWSAPRDAFPRLPADGIYHGAAMSAVADGEGGLHLVYKDQNELRLWYRHFDGERFHARVEVDDSAGDWALQPASSLVGGELFILDNHVTAGGYQTRMWRLSAGLGPAAATTLEDESAFYGYPSMPETLPGDATSIACLHSRTPAPDVPGAEISLRIAPGPPGVEVALASPSLESDGFPGSVAVALVPENGYSGEVSLSVAGAPAGSDVAFAPAAVSLPGTAATATLTLEPGTAANGDYPLTLTAAFAGGQVSTPLTWSIERPPPAATLSTDRFLLAAGTSADTAVRLLPLAWFAGRIGVAISGLPAGVQAKIAPSAVLPGERAILTLSADANAADASADCTVTLTAPPMESPVGFRVSVLRAPKAALTSPADGALVSGSVAVEIAGEVSALTTTASVELLVDGRSVARAATAPARFTWDTTAVSDGTHRLSPRVTDAAGGVAEGAPVVVTVDNAVVSDAGTAAGSADAGAAPGVAASGGCSSAGVEPLATVAAALMALARRRRPRPGAAKSKPTRGGSSSYRQQP
ncbi:MAG TPA: Ig-like domain-containing protein [Myxococcales bacterium]